MSGQSTETGDTLPRFERWLRDRINHARWSRTWWLVKRHTTWRIEGWLLAWTADVEPTHDGPGLLAQDEDGDWLVPHGTRDGEPWWQGYWRWWRPDHWPVYIRTRRARTWVMVERWG